MDRQERAQLLLEKEEAEESIVDLKKQLNDVAVILRNLGGALAQNAHLVVFFNAPDALGEHPASLGGSKVTFNWQQLPDMTAVAKLIQELRKQQHRLQEAQKKLAAPR